MRRRVVDKEVILDNEYMTIWYYPQKKIVHHQIHKFTYGQALRDGLSAGAARFEERGGSKIFSR
jgi:hypothetical protein